MSRNKKLSSKLTPIRSTESLAKHLGFEHDQLVEIAHNKDNLWRPGARLPKKNSSEIRVTNDAREPLKTLHDRINRRLLRKFDYPPYLHGSIYVPDSPRSPRSNAAAHTKQRLIIEEDIANFFPSTTQDHIERVWRYCFHFSPEVARLLAELTSYKRSLPQGWKPSSYLANLAFFDREPTLVRKLESSGFTYTRYVDDITVSSATFVSASSKTKAIKLIYGMLTNNGYQPKRKKHKVISRNNVMNVTGFSVNGRKPKVTREYQRKVRAEIHRLQLECRNLNISDNYSREWRSAEGKVRRIQSSNPNRAAKMMALLNEIRP